VQLRLAVQRLRILQDKKEALAKKSRRDIATLLEKSKIETAKLRVESMINEDIHVELLELLELYCELLIARFGILDINSREPDPQISEAVCSIIHAAPRTEVKELHILREMLMHKYGREFAIGVMENKDSCVSERVMKKISFETPDENLVNAYLGEIAKAYNVNWMFPAAPNDDDRDDYGGDDGGGGGGGGLKETVLERELEPALLADLPATKGIEVVKHDGKANIPSLPPTEDETLPTYQTLASGGKATIPAAPKAAPSPPAEEDDFDALTRRFAALKRR